MYTDFTIGQLKKILADQMRTEDRAIMFVQMLTGRYMDISDDWWKDGTGQTLLYACRNWEKKIHMDMCVYEDGEVLSVVKW